MKKLNKKGFLLVETLVVTVFVISIFIFIYTNSIPLIGKYEQRFKYDDLDSVYAVDLVRNMIYLEDESYLIANIWSKVPTTTGGSNLERITCNDLSSTNRDFCTALLKELDIKEIWLTHYNLNSIKEGTYLADHGINNSNNRGLKAYIDYLPNFQNNTLVHNQHRLIIKREVEELGITYTRYANIELMH